MFYIYWTKNILKSLFNPEELPLSDKKHLMSGFTNGRGDETNWVTLKDRSP